MIPPRKGSFNAGRRRKGDRRPRRLRTARYANACASIDAPTSHRVGGFHAWPAGAVQPACSSELDCARRRRPRSRRAAAPANAEPRGRPMRRSAPTKSRRRPARKNPAGRYWQTQRHCGRAISARQVEEADCPARARKGLVNAARRGRSPSRSSGAPVRARMKSSISALPGPVSQAIGSPPSKRSRWRRRRH